MLTGLAKLAMRLKFGSDPNRRWRSEGGGVAVEFAILLPVFLLLVFGIVDFGHAWYMKQLVSNASREGARYGTRYTTNAAGTHILPTALSPTIASWITTQYTSLLPSDANLQVTPGGAGYTSGTAGTDLSVQVTATKHWWVVGSLVPGLGSSVNVNSTTVMKVE
jgi:Flp pilus assembly protein TadG